MDGSGDTRGGQLCGGLGGGIDFKTATRAWPNSSSSSSPGRRRALLSHAIVASHETTRTCRRYCIRRTIIVLSFIIVHNVRACTHTSHYASRDYINNNY